MIRTEKVEFAGANGALLAGRLDRPAGRPRAFGLFAHCFTCSKDVFASQRIATGLAERGIAVLRFDFTGLGGSAGDFGNTNFSSNIADLVAAADFLRAQHEAPRILIGHSLGGAAVRLAAVKIPECAAVATLNAPFDPQHVQHLFADSLDTIKREGAAKVTLAGRSFTVSKDFVDDLMTHAPAENLRQLKRALLLFHATHDKIVGIENARLAYEAALHPKSFIALDGADHFISKREDAAYVADLLAAWADRYLGDGERVAAPQAAAGTVVVTGAGEGTFPQLVSAHGHPLRADEPVEVGGTDSGPGPYDFLLAGLGACTAMTVRMYAERKKWPLENVHVTLRHNKIHAEDCAECETKAGMLDRMERVIRLDGPLDAEQKARLMEIADKCPVHRTLTSEIRIESRMVEG
ncbi:MAG TPA: alpha/beta fold hydrolase [Dongiaceae bacterium]|jgi:putative redox protein|nr:alpha/beta fold hydrolase [Dongiaceae bacterium]